MSYAMRKSTFLNLLEDPDFYRGSLSDTWRLYNLSDYGRMNKVQDPHEADVIVLPYASWVDRFASPRTIGGPVPRGNWQYILEECGNPDWLTTVKAYIDGVENGIDLREAPERSTKYEILYDILVNWPYDIELSDTHTYAQFERLIEDEYDNWIEYNIGKHISEICERLSKSGPQYEDLWGLEDGEAWGDWHKSHPDGDPPLFCNGLQLLLDSASLHDLYIEIDMSGEVMAGGYYIDDNIGLLSFTILALRLHSLGQLSIHPIFDMLSECLIPHYPVHYHHNWRVQREISREIKIAYRAVQILMGEEE